MLCSETTDSPQIRVLHSFTEGMRKRDVDLVAQTFHKDFRRITHPRSLNTPECNKEEWLQKLTELFGVLTEDGEPTFHFIVEIPGIVITHVTATAKTSVGMDMIREMLITAHTATDEDGSLKIKQLEVFLDSKVHLDFFKAIAEAKAEREHSASYAA